MSAPRIPEAPKASYNYIDEWDPVSKKTGGATSGGELGGRYRDLNHPEREVFFKQDADVAKVIGEYVSAYLMNAVAKSDPEHPNGLDLIAHVELAVKNPDVNPLEDTEGKCVYLASAGFNGFVEVWKDAYAAIALLDKYEPIRSDSHYNDVVKKINPQKEKDGTPVLTTREDRPGVFKLDDVITTMIEHGRYTWLAKILVLALWLDDFDIHFSNIGVVPNPNTKQSTNELHIYKEKGSNEIKIVHNDVLLVRIDTGASFSDGTNAVRGFFMQKRGFDDKLHLEKFLLPSKSGPVNHFKAFSKLIFRSGQVNRELNLLHDYKEAELSRSIDLVLANVSQYFTVESIRKYAKMISYPGDVSKMQKQALLQGIKSHLMRNLQARQVEAKKLADKLDNKNRNQFGMLDEKVLMKVLNEFTSILPSVSKGGVFAKSKAHEPPVPTNQSRHRP